MAQPEGWRCLLDALTGLTVILLAVRFVRWGLLSERIEETLYALPDGLLRRRRTLLRGDVAQELAEVLPWSGIESAVFTSSAGRFLPAAASFLLLAGASLGIRLVWEGARSGVGALLAAGFLVQLLAAGMDLMLRWLSRARPARSRVAIRLRGGRVIAVTGIDPGQASEFLGVALTRLSPG